MDISNVTLIGDVKDYKKALDRIKKLFDSEPGSKEHNELELLVMLVENYENKHYEIPESDPISIIHFVMEQRGLKQNDLVGILGDKTNVSKVLNRHRPLTLDMIRNFSKAFNISSELLINEYELAKSIYKSW